MNWLDRVARPKIGGFFRKKETPENLWHKCRKCGEMAFHRDLLAARNVCPNCDHHMRLTPAARLEGTFDDGTYETIEAPEVTVDPLKFRDKKKYTDRLKEAKAKTESTDAVIIAAGKITGQDTIVLVQNFEFMGGSLGMAAGEAIVKAAEIAIDRKLPLILFAASGGARMQEGVLSLMQMPRTTVAVERVKEAGLPYIVILTDPTTGGVTASYAMLGDIQIAEPDAVIGFAGARVIEQTIHEKLPAGFQRSEFLLEHGMIDMVVHRHEMRETLSRIIRLLMTKNTRPPSETTEQEETPSTLPVPANAAEAPATTGKVTG
jgi:acetyl-CoA carboxylase carboxyl transferase subunit beta